MPTQTVDFRPDRRHMEEFVNDWLRENHTDVARRLRRVSSALYRMENELMRCEETDLAAMIHSGAVSIDRISAQVDAGDARELIELLELQGHIHPAGALLAGMTAGLLGACETPHRPETGPGLESAPLRVEPRYSPACTRVTLVYGELGIVHWEASGNKSA